jgi:hypothetical protein
MDAHKPVARYQHYRHWPTRVYARQARAKNRRQWPTGSDAFCTVCEVAPGNKEQGDANRKDRGEQHGVWAFLIAGPYDDEPKRNDRKNQKC